VPTAAEQGVVALEPLLAAPLLVEALRVELVSELLSPPVPHCA
jgi:hypothetical protein